MTREPDPLAELVATLKRAPKPPLAWVVRWGAGGIDPLVAAWHASVRPLALLEVIWRVDPASGVVAADALFDACCLSRTERSYCARCLRERAREPSLPRFIPLALQRAERLEQAAPAWLLCTRIRRAVPTPPTLAALLAAVTRPEAPPCSPTT